jgi:hypothetical protein
MARLGVVLLVLASVATRVRGVEFTNALGLRDRELAPTKPAGTSGS